MILVVDDAVSSAGIVTSILRDVTPPNQVTSLNPSLARDYLMGKGAFAGQKPPAAAVVDFNMKPPAGQEMVKWIRGTPYLSEVPVLAFGYSWMADDVDELRKLPRVQVVELSRVFDDAKAKMAEVIAAYLKET
jgi:hypothetical protein